MTQTTGVHEGPRDRALRLKPNKLTPQQVILKLWFQVPIVLSSADEARPAVCTMVHGGGTVVLVYRVLFSGPCIRLVSGFMSALLYM